MLDPHTVADAPVRRMLAPIALALAFAFGAPAVASNSFYAVVPVSGVNGQGQLRPVKMVLAGATPPPATVGMPYSFNLGALLSLDGPEGTSPSDVSWSIVSGELPAGLELVGNEVVGTPTALAPDRQVVIQAEYAFGYSTARVVAGYSYVVSVASIADFGGYRAWADGTYAQSCEAYIQPVAAEHVYAGSTGDGVYRITPNGQSPFDVYCDMTSDGGGWTRVVLQYEETPVGWSGQVNGTAYTLAPSKIPAHTLTSFGKDNQATFVDYFLFTYTTGNIPVTVVTSPKTGIKYQINRNSNLYYNGHDPEAAVHVGANPPNNALSIDKVGVLYSFSWSFAPSDTQAMRGYGIAGEDHEYVQDAFGWSVWVR